MSTQKILFAIIGIIFIWALFFLMSVLTSWQGSKSVSATQWKFTVWILSDDAGDFQSYLWYFKEAFPQYRSKNIVVESFLDMQTYKNTLISAIGSEKAPDVFMLPAWEESIFENFIAWVDPERVSPSDFRLAFRENFSQDLIVSTDDDTREFLRWVPAWYETLWFFYNRKYFLKPSELNSWNDIEKEIQNISYKHSNIVPLALWATSGMLHLSDILGAFFVLDGVRDLWQIPNTTVKQWLAQYLSYGDRSWSNGYDAVKNRYPDKTELDFFVEGEVAAMIWYPRDLFAIDSVGYQKSFLFVRPFPQYASEFSEKKIFAKYNFFATHKDTQFYDMAQDFLSFVVSQTGQEKYIETFPHYLSPSLMVMSDISEKKILPAYNIVYKNFLPEEGEVVTFNFGDIQLFESEIVSVLKQWPQADIAFADLRAYIRCSSMKHSSLMNLSNSCK